MVEYVIGIVLVCIGFIIPPLDGVEYILIFIGGYLFFKKFNKDNGFGRK
ncbi:hypothetical protein [Halarcobacter sp.]|nr:hypothetical protein [Halarcobacter sp.]